MSPSDSPTDQPRDQWVSWAAAGELLGLGSGVIRGYIAAGKLQTRPRRGASPTIYLPSLRQLADELEAAKRLSQRTVRPHSPVVRARPPDDQHVWLGTTAAGYLLGITGEWARRRAHADTLPHVVHDGRVWFRRDLIEQIAAASAFRSRQHGD